MDDVLRYYQKLKSGEFELLCTTISLRLAPSYSETLFSGSGIIRAKRGGFQVKMVGRAHSECLLDLWPHGRRHNTGGAPFSWYQLSAQAVDGSEWVGSNWVRPNIISGFLDGLSGAPVGLECTLQSIITEDVSNMVDDFSKGDHYFFVASSAGRVWWSGWTSTESDGPWGRSVQRKASFHDVATAGMRIVLEEGPDAGDVSVDITPAGTVSLPAFADISVLQGLQMLVARPVDFSVQYRRGTHQRMLRLVGVRSSVATLPPPCRPGDGDWGADYWAVFDSFVQYLNGEPVNPLWHPFGEAFLLILEASSRSFDAYALALSVAVEAVLTACRKADPDGSDAVLSAEDIAALKHHLAGCPGGERVRRRLEGFVAGQMQSWTASDRMRKLVALKVLDRADIKAWQAVRHSVAHGGKRPPSLYGDSDCNRVLEAFYKIVLREAGYAGRINPFG